MKERSVIVALVAVGLAMLMGPSQSFGKDPYTELWRFAINNSSHKAWCAKTGACAHRPLVRFTPIEPRVLGEVTWDERDVVNVIPFMDPQYRDMIIVHEMVHVLQFQRNLIDPQNSCTIMKAEEEAYQVGIKYAHSKGVYVPTSMTGREAIDQLTQSCIHRGVMQ